MDLWSAYGFTSPQNWRLNDVLLRKRGVPTRWKNRFVENESRCLSKALLCIHGTGVRPIHGEVNVRAFPSRLSDKRIFVAISAAYDVHAFSVIREPLPFVPSA